MLLHELVKTVSMQVTLWRGRREFARLQREFPPRSSARSFRPALALLALGALAAAWSLGARQHRNSRARVLRHQTGFHGLTLDLVADEAKIVEVKLKEDPVPKASPLGDYPDDRGRH